MLYRVPSRGSYKGVGPFRGLGLYPPRSPRKGGDRGCYGSFGK